MAVIPDFRGEGGWPVGLFDRRFAVGGIVPEISGLIAGCLLNGTNERLKA